MASRVILAKYGVAFTYPVTLINANTGNFATTADYTEATGDVQVSKDNGAYANRSFGLSAVAGTNGTTWNHVLTATEMQAKFIRVLIADASPKAILDEEFIIQTFGDANASIIADLSQANLFANIKAINDDTLSPAQLALMFAGNMTYGTAQLGTSTTITLAAGASATNDYYYKSTVCIVAGTGVGQTPREIIAYNGTSKVATVDTAWSVNPDNTSKYQIIGRIA